MPSEDECLRLSVGRADKELMQSQASTREALYLRAPTQRRDRFRGCLLSGAVGDALGAGVEFQSRAQTLKQFGSGGIRDFAPAYGRFGAITDDTQMTLFTAEGLIRAYVRGTTRGVCSVPGIVSHAYLRWLITQGVRSPVLKDRGDGWLVSIPELHAQRAPGRTCMNALRSLQHFGDLAQNDSKGCGGVMRVAPVGMLYPEEEAFRLAVEIAGITHGHPTGKLSAGAFAAIVAALLSGSDLPSAIKRSLGLLVGHEGHDETTQAIERARELAGSRPSDPEALSLLGEGWIAEEALAISLYCALSSPDLESALILAVNHDGDSDSTGSIAGNLLGAIHGTAAIPERWLTKLELRDVIEQVADDMASLPYWHLDSAGDWLTITHLDGTMSHPTPPNAEDVAEQNYLWERYPG